MGFLSKLGFVVLLLVVLVWSVFVFSDDRGFVLNPFQCVDGSWIYSCSSDKPLFCSSGVLVERSSFCGCPDGFRARNNSCIPIVKCSDGSLSPDCSKFPFQCVDGVLVENPSLCGCPEFSELVGGSCVPRFLSGEKSLVLPYVVRGVDGSISFTVYEGLKEYLADLPRYFVCDPVCPVDSEKYLSFINQGDQVFHLSNLVSEIRDVSSVPDEQARIAISLVQQIPYDWDSLKSGNLKNRYPYEVLVDSFGVCGEKSQLLAFLLRDLGFGVALLTYPFENHQAVGIKCSSDYDIADSGYCFVETTNPSVITFSKGNYGSTGKLSHDPDITVISDGLSFDASEEFFDLKRLDELNAIGESNGGRLSDDLFDEWSSLVKKYRLNVVNETDS